MKLEMTMTERDKKLLMVLGVFLIVCGLGAGVYKPLHNARMNAESELQVEKEEKQKREYKVVSLPAVRANLETLKKSWADTSKEYYSLMKSKDIDQMLTGMALEKNLNIKSIQISVGSVYDTVAFGSYLLGDLGGALDNQTYSDGIVQAEVQFVLSGSEEDLQSLLDDCMHSRPGMHVTTFQWSARGENGEAVLSLNLKLFMLKEVEF